MRDKGLSGFKCQRSNKGRSLEATLEESQGVFSPFFLPLGGFIFGKPVFGREVVLVILPNAGKEVIKSPDTRRITEGEPAEDGIKGSFLKHTAPNSNRKEEKNYFYALHLFGVLSVVVEYGYLLEYWPVSLTLAREKMVGIITASGYGVLLLGFAFVLLGRLYLNSFCGKDIYTYEEKETYKLVQDNVYSLCRHPIYFGQVCMCIGTAFALNNGIIVAFAFLMLLMNLYRAEREDKFLQSFFGDEWEEYQKKVNFFFPFF